MRLCVSFSFHPNKQLIFQKEKEISVYMDIINNISSMFKFNTNGQIIESNDMLSEVSQYSKDELENIQIDDILHLINLIQTVLGTNLHEMLQY